jgi:AraC family transcriptional regulator, transcriptional activator of pobA
MQKLEFKRQEHHTFATHMQQPTLKTYEYHSFLRDVLQRTDERAYFLASETDFQLGAPLFPYRNYFYGLGIALEGNRTIRIGTELFEMKANSVMMIGPGILRHWQDDHFMAKQEAIFFTPDLFQLPIQPQFLTEIHLFKPNIKHVLDLTEPELAPIKQIFDLLRSFERQEPIVASLVLTLIEMLKDLQAKQTTEKGKNLESSARAQQILHAFDVLLQKHYLEHHEVSFYAEKMHLTPNHMSEVIKAYTGKSAKKRIDDILLIESKSLLKQTSMTIKEITYWLGFDDPSYFTKFFKQGEGVTPNAYRKN